MAEVLAGLSEALAGVVESAGAAVLRVEGRERLPATGILWSADGVVVTAHHVLEQDENIRLGLPDGHTVPATLVGRDPTTDLAVLRAETTGLRAPAWADPGSLRVGHLVLALGRPGRTVMATLGIISALGDAWRTPAGGQLERYLQTDIVMYPGFSGGPLVDTAGQVIGLNTSGVLRGISIAVPAPTIRQVVEMLLAHGKVRRGYLGIGTQAVRLPEGVARQLGQETGLLLLSVEPESPADQGGLMLGDTIVAVEGRPIRHLDDLQAGLSGDRIGQPATVRIVRGGQLQEQKVTVGERQ